MDGWEGLAPRFEWRPSQRHLLDLAGHVVDRRWHLCAKSFARFTRNRFDRVITLCDKVREVAPQLRGAPIIAHWSIPDPAAGG